MIRLGRGTQGVIHSIHETTVSTSFKPAIRGLSMAQVLYDGARRWFQPPKHLRFNPFYVSNENNNISPPPTKSTCAALALPLALRPYDANDLNQMLGVSVLHDVAVAEESCLGGFYIRKEMYMQADRFSFHEHR